MSNRILKFSVPVDDEPHEVPGLILHLACQNSYDSVEVWVEEDTISDYGTKQYQVFGTGQPLPEEAIYIGTALAAGGALVWHLVEV